MPKNSLDTQLAANDRQLAQRRAMNDQLEVPREVDHFAYFRKRADAETVAELLRDQGLVVALSGSGRKTELAAHGRSAVDPATVSAFVTAIFRTVEAHGGVYDGWGGPIVGAASDDAS